MNQKIKHIALILFAALLFLPVLIQPLGFVKIKGLKGYFVTPGDSSLNVNYWTKGIYQPAKEENCKYKLKVRPLLVRVYNEVRFLLYGDISARNVALGRNGYYYEKHYINAWLGNDFIGEDTIVKKLNAYKTLLDTLNQHGIQMLFVLAPGKVTVYPEYIPVEFESHKKRTTNYEIFKRELASLNIPHIDFNNYFKEIKDTVNFPIYPKGGTHWSVYGSCIAFDTIIRYIEYLTKKDLPDYTYTAFDVTKKARSSDDDIARATNRIWIRKEEKLLYPYLEVTDSSGKTKPDLLTIADSYYWTIVGTGFLKYFFTDFNFWYYFKENHTQNPDEPKMVNGYQDLKKEIEKRDIVLFIITDGNLNEFSWGFVNTVLSLYVN
ncbi:hypothetical protein ACFLRI_00095 [Bacteroidota bacterium]